MAVDAATVRGGDVAASGPPALETEIRRVGEELAQAGGVRWLHPLRSLDEWAMQLASQDARRRAALFRLVDVTPACRSPDELARHFREYASEVGVPAGALGHALRLSGSWAARKAVGTAAAAGVRHIAHRFIVGESPGSARRVLGALWREGIASSVDLLGEATVTAEEADRYARRCHDALEWLTQASASWPPRPLLAHDSAGPLSRVNISVKITALTPLLRPQAPGIGLRDAATRLRPLLRRARDAGSHIHIDSESLDSLETTMELVAELLGEREFAEGPSVGIVLQAYLRDSASQLDWILEHLATIERRPPLSVRLVKGAYWDHEVVEAHQHRWAAPVFEQKAESDRNFEQLTRRLLDARPLVRPIVASHNLRSVAHAIAYNRTTRGEDRDLEVQVLRGLGDDLARSLARMGMRVRAYCPIGDLVAGMAYLVRRLLENTANEGFVQKQARDLPLDELLAAP